MVASPSTAFPETAVSVAGVTDYIKALLEQNQQLHQIWVVGEVSSANAHGKGLFLTLQDPETGATLNGVIWKSQLAKVVTVPQVGEQVIVLGQVKVYTQRSQYQLTIWQCLAAGDGLAALRFRQLQQRLAAEGLFDAAEKRSLPRHPQTIAVVTSPQAAAWGDIQRTLRHRYPGLRVLLSPATVQGETAPASIAQALDRVATDGRAELVILARGGGAAEDLACFNDERVVRAIADCPIPIISGIGHERDESLADLAADVYAHTPTAAAAQAVPELALLWEDHQELKLRLRQAMAWQMMEQGDRLTQLQRRLQRSGVTQQLEREQAQLQWLRQRSRQALGQRLAQAQQQQAALGQTLAALDPHAVLQRGYALVRSERSGAVLRNAQPLQPGDPISIQLAQGSVQAQVTAVEL
ncbi:MAG: exodeoxyribonuclease VII large subunit [Synechococcales cyanobacterium RM1_1_8]|nr:exodeoxyribonuclease VII large subunit [Synechococcales cyanobacterium RM1_1_8]